MTNTASGHAFPLPTRAMNYQFHFLVPRRDSSIAHKNEHPLRAGSIVNKAYSQRYRKKVYHAANMLYFYARKGTYPPEKP